MGSSNNTIKDNTITDSVQNAILLMPANDAAIYTTRSGRPTSNLFKNNIISGTGSYGVRVIDADTTTIQGKSMTRLGGPLLFVRTAGSVLDKVKLPAQQPITVTGSPTVRSALTLGVPRKTATVTADQYSTVTWK